MHPGRQVLLNTRQRRQNYSVLRESSGKFCAKGIYSLKVFVQPLTVHNLDLVNTLDSYLTEPYPRGLEGCVTYICFLALQQFFFFFKYKSLIGPDLTQFQRTSFVFVFCNNGCVKISHRSSSRFLHSISFSSQTLSIVPL